jgi:hypothetical protein
MELVAERQPLAQFDLDAAALIGLLEADHVPLDGPAFGRADADHATDAVFAMKSKMCSEPLSMLIRACARSFGRFTVGYRA